MKKFVIIALLLFTLLFCESTVPVLADTGVLITSARDLEYEEPDIVDFFNSINEFVNTVGEFFSSFHDSIYILFPFLPEGMVTFFLTFVSIFLGLELYFLVRRLTV